MKNLTILFAILFISFLFTTNSFAQPDNGKFKVAIIKVKAPEEQEAFFIEASLREELIRAGKIKISESADTLIVNFSVQHNEKANPDYGRDGKWGEISLSVISKNGCAASTSREYVSKFEGYLYYDKIKKLVKKVAENFEYIK